MRNTVPLVGKSGVIDALVGLLQLSALLCACMCRLSPSIQSMCHLGLPVGMFSSYRSIGHVLTRPCMSPVVLMCIATPFMPMHIFSALAQVLHLSLFVGLLGKLSDFMVF